MTSVREVRTGLVEEAARDVDVLGALDEDRAAAVDRPVARRRNLRQARPGRATAQAGRKKSPSMMRFAGKNRHLVDTDHVRQVMRLRLKMTGWKHTVNTHMYICVA